LKRLFTLHFGRKKKGKNPLFHILLSNSDFPLCRFVPGEDPQIVAFPHRGLETDVSARESRQVDVKYDARAMQKRSLILQVLLHFVVGKRETFSPFPDRIEK